MQHELSWCALQAFLVHAINEEESAMHLLDSELKNKEQWEKAGIALPEFDREAMKVKTKETPQWISYRRPP